MTVNSESFEDAIGELIPAETDRVQALYADAVVRQIWLRADLPGACFLIEAPDPDAAQEIVQTLELEVRESLGQPATQNHELHCFPILAFRVCLGDGRVSSIERRESRPSALRRSAGMFNFVPVRGVPRTGTPTGMRLSILWGD